MKRFNIDKVRDDVGVKLGAIGADHNPGHSKARSNLDVFMKQPPEHRLRFTDDLIQVDQHWTQDLIPHG